MSNKTYLVSILLLLAILAGACNYPGYSRPTVTSTLPSTIEPDQGLIQVDPDCTSALIPGRWTGSVAIDTTASSMGFRVIDQTASISLILDVTCAGEITGSASRQGSGEINVPFMLNGTCTENAQYQVSGLVLSEDPSPPILRLIFSTLEGALSCNLESNISSFPSGEQSKDLVGTSFTVDMVPDSIALTQISGNQWPDTFYQDLFSGTQNGIEEYDVVTKTMATWSLTYQK
jgi:hypothetical protein